MKEYSDPQMMIEDYLGNHMTPDDMAQVERMANDDPELARQIKEQRLLIAALQEQGRRQNDDFARKMKEIPRDEMEKFIASKRKKHVATPARHDNVKKKRPAFLKTWVVRAMAAAAVVLGVVLGFNLFLHSSSPSYSARQQAQIDGCMTSIYGAQFLPTRGDGARRLAEAIELTQSSDEAKHKQGVEALRDIFEHPETDEIRNHAGECLAIALIADGDLDRADDLVKQIPDAEYHDQLLSLLNDLK